MKQTLTLFIILSYCTFGFSQAFINGDLNGTVNSWSDLPTSWQSIPHTDIHCQATSSTTATPDLTNLMGPDSSQGVIGNPFSGATFVSGLDASLGASYWHEGIQQRVGDFIPNSTYAIHFYQTVVKQEYPAGGSFYALDTSGSWSVYLDDSLITTTNASNSTLPFNSTNLVWDFRSIEFTATSDTHMIKFLPADDDTISESSGNNGGLRMGIDNISISKLTGMSSGMGSATAISAFPNPTTGSLRIDLKKVYQNIKVELTDLYGRIVLSNTYSNSKEIDLFFNGSQGIYFLKVRTEMGVFPDFKLIKE